MSVVDASFDHPLKLEERASMTLAGGLLQHGYQCGMLWGATQPFRRNAKRSAAPLIGWPKER
ncbi:MAG: hypothetical protein WBD56_13970 [Anaerolineales bacterium]